MAPNGQVLRTDYVADGAGYRVASNALPVGPGAGPAPVVDTPEVSDRISKISKISNVHIETVD